LIQSIDSEHSTVVSFGEVTGLAVNSLFTSYYVSTGPNLGLDVILTKHMLRFAYDSLDSPVVFVAFDLDIYMLELVSPWSTLLLLVCAEF
jgi:hypothetical protein